MTLAQTGRARSSSNIGTGNTTITWSTTNMVGSAPVAGDLLFAVWTIPGGFVAGNQVTVPAGWTEVLAPHTAGTGTLATHIMAKVLTGLEAISQVFTVVGATPWTLKAFWIHSDGVGISSFTSGSFVDRAPSGSSTTTLNVAGLTSAPSATPALVVAMATERTIATETDAQLTVSGSGWVKAYSEAASSDQSLVVAYKTMTDPANTGVCTFTYPNVHAQNATGIQVVIYETEVIAGFAPVVKGWSYNYKHSHKTVYVPPNNLTQSIGNFMGDVNGSPMAVGDWVVVIWINNGDLNTGTPPTGWSIWKDPLPIGNGATYGMAAYYRISNIQNGTFDFNDAFTGGGSYICIWGSGGDPDPRTWIVGAWQQRTALADANKTYIARAPGITTIRDKSLVLVVATERTAALETNTPGMPTNVNAAAGTFPTFQAIPRLLWRIPGDNEPTFTGLVAMGSKVISPAGAVPDETITFENFHVANGMAAMIAIPPVPTGSAPATNMVITGFVPQFDQNTLQVGTVLTAGATSWRLLVSTNMDLSSPVFFTGTLSARKFGTARATSLTPGTLYYIGFEVNGTIQTDYTLRARTMRLAGTPASFKFLAGSCQHTGLNHASIARMESEGADFLGHMGDLHYSDATTEPAWESGMLQSLTTPNERALLKITPIDYIWDNHDRIIVDTLNEGTTLDQTRQVYRELAGDNFPLTYTQNRSWVSGRVRFIHTDAWSVRDDPDLVAEPRTMFGSAQKQWLKDTLTAAREPLIVWFCSFPNHNVANGRWNNFNAEVEELEAWLEVRPGIKQRIVMLGGDSHDLRADSGTRKGTGNSHNFIGIPSLNASGITQTGDTPWVTAGWDIAEAAVGLSVGCYARCTITDDGFTLKFLWEAVAGTTGTVIAAWSRIVGTAKVGTSDGVFSYWNAAQGRMIPVGVKFPT